jgi:hypothetical protein
VKARGYTEPGAGRDQHLVRRAARLADSYINLSGASFRTCFVRSSNICNVPSSRFLRPWSSALSPAERVRLRRILGHAMSNARNKRRVFIYGGIRTISGFIRRRILQFSKLCWTRIPELRDLYDFKSVNMHDFVDGSSLLYK